MFHNVQNELPQVAANVGDGAAGRLHFVCDLITGVGHDGGDGGVRRNKINEVLTVIDIVDTSGRLVSVHGRNHHQTDFKENLLGLGNNVRQLEILIFELHVLAALIHASFKEAHTGKLQLLEHIHGGIIHRRSLSGFLGSSHIYTSNISNNFFLMELTLRVFRLGGFSPRKSRT